MLSSDSQSGRRPGRELVFVVEQLPRYVRELLESAPARGDGLNRWTFNAARSLHRCGVQLSDSMVEELIEVYGGPDVKQHEVQRSVRRGRIDPTGSEYFASLPKWPQRNLGKIEEIALGNPGLTGLRSLSPVDGATVDAEEAVDHLFPGNPLLCVGLNLNLCETLPREEWRGRLNGQQFIVPSPMLAPLGSTQDGASSPRALTNTGPRRFLVIEFDFRERDNEGVDTPNGPMLRRLNGHGITVADICASLHHHLRRYWPLAMVVHSGGKSLHGWYPCVGRSEEELHNFMQFAVSLGADTATWTRCQFVRVPSGIRRPGKIRQSIHFIDPSTLPSTPRE